MGAQGQGQGQQSLKEGLGELVKGYKGMVEQLDVVKVQCQGDELERMTRDREYIALLEKERNGHSSRLDEYVKRNQRLQTKLADRERKLRHTQNTLNRLNQQQHQQQQQQQQRQ